eukprot:gene2524-4908_t
MKKSASVEQAALRVKDGMTFQQQAHVYHREGKAFFDNGDVQGALDCFNVAISLNPLAVFYINRAACHKQLQKFTEAYFDYSFAIRLEPESGSYYCQRGLCSAKLQKLTLALEDLDDACRMDPIPLHFYCRASVCAEAEDHEAAIKDLTKVIDDVQRTTADLRIRSLHRRGASYYEVGNYDASDTDLTLVCTLDPRNILPYVLHGKVLKVRGNLEGAEECLNHSIDIQPTMYELYVERADIRMRIGDRANRIDAVKDFDRAVDLIRYGSKMAILVAGVHSVRTLRHNGTSSSSIQDRTNRTISRDENGNANTLQSELEDVDDIMRISSDIKRLQSPPTLSQSLSQSSSLSPKKAPAPPPLLKQRSARGAANRGMGGGGGMGGFHGAGAGSFPRKESMGIGMPNSGDSISIAIGEEIEDKPRLLSDILNRRAQAKLLLQDDAIVRSALDDALEAVRLRPDDEFFQMVAAVCYQRRGDAAEALYILESVLEAHPHNCRALFHQAFCQRSDGKFMDSIESLTKIIAYYHSQYENRIDGTDDCSNNNNNTTTTDIQHSKVPNPISKKKKNIKQSQSSSQLQQQQQLHMNSNKPKESHSQPPVQIQITVPMEHVFEMRGALFHGLKMYKMAAKDLGLAIGIDESRPEPYFLRGDCHCRLGSHEQALEDFSLAELHGFHDRPALLAARGAVHRLVHQPECALRDFEAALDALTVEAEMNGFTEGFVVTAISIRLRAFVALCLLDQKQYDKAHEHIERTMELLEEIEPDELPTAAPPRMQWTLIYHDALSMYMQCRYELCLKTLLPCVTTLKEHAPDPFDIGAALFFVGVSQSLLGNQQETITTLNECLSSEWAALDRQQALCLFARGKALQRLGRHEEAVTDFNTCVEFNENDAHACFRRAWSYKALGKYEMAAVDFEHAKNIRFDDPNFAIQYRSIHDVEYMEIESDPDLVEPFPTLLPLPAFHAPAAGFDSRAVCNPSSEPVVNLKKTISGSALLLFQSGLVFDLSIFLFNCRYQTLTRVPVVEPEAFRPIHRLWDLCVLAFTQAASKSNILMSNTDRLPPDRIGSRFDQCRDTSTQVSPAHIDGNSPFPNSVTMTMAEARQSSISLLMQ